MADQYAIQDQNRFPALLGHTGTAGTAETVRIVSTTGGAITTGIASGTITTGSLANIGVVHNAGTMATGSLSDIATLHNGTVYTRGAYDNFSQDASTEALISVDYAHHEIHDGSHFFVHGFATVGAGTNLDFTVTTPGTTKWAHMLFSFQPSAQTEFYVYENCTIGTGGVTVTAENSNRNSSGTSVLVVKNGPVISNAGSLISSYSSGTSQNQQISVGGGGRTREDELILKQNEDYLFRFTSRANGNIISFQGNWYEHTDKN